MANTSGNKGKTFERDISKLLNKMFNTKEFTRTPGSGNFMGLSNSVARKDLSSSAKNTLSSDLIVPDWFKFSIECKWYKDSPQYHGILNGSDCDLDRWIGETLFDSLNLKLIPMLFFKTNRKGTFVVMPYWFVNLFNFPTAVKYYEMVIFPICNIETIRENLETVNEDILDQNFNWLTTSKYVQDTIDIMIKGKKQNGNRKLNI